MRILQQYRNPLTGFRQIQAVLANGKIRTWHSTEPGVWKRSPYWLGPTGDRLLASQLVTAAPAGWSCNVPGNSYKQLSDR